MTMSLIKLTPAACAAMDRWATAEAAKPSPNGNLYLAFAWLYAIRRKEREMIAAAVVFRVEEGESEDVDLVAREMNL